jgi:hypothetical protein
MLALSNKEIGLGTYLVHTNSDGAKKEKKAVTFAILCTMWYKEKVSTFEIAVAKLNETL